MTAAYTVGAVVAGLLLVGSILAGLYKIDESWLPRHRLCPVCHHAWLGTPKLCQRCGGRAIRAGRPS